SPEKVFWRNLPQQPPAEELEKQFLDLCRKYHKLEVWNNDVAPDRLPRLVVGSGKWETSRTIAFAKHVRDTLRLGDRPGASLPQRLEELGVKVCELELKPNSASACALGETFGPAVLLPLGVGVGKSHLLAFHLYELAWLSSTSGEAAPVAG